VVWLNLTTWLTGKDSCTLSVRLSATLSHLGRRPHWIDVLAIWALAGTRSDLPA
jgi:hypothetical protein